MKKIKSNTLILSNYWSTLVIIIVWKNPQKNKTNDKKKSKLSVQFYKLPLRRPMQKMR